MLSKTKGNPLTAFVRFACSHYVKSEGGCAYSYCNSCKVMSGYPCSYFRRAVLSPVGYVWPEKYLSDNPTREETIRELYGAIDTKSFSARLKVETRKCPDCGKALIRGRRYCDTCRISRSNKSKKKYKRFVNR